MQKSKNVKQLNEKQRKILDFLKQQIEEKGYPPSVREICSAMGYKSTSTVHGYIEQLQKNGYLQKDPTKPRALKIIDNESSAKRDMEYYTRKELVEVPVVGKVTAGMPILATENIEDTFPLPVDLVQNSTAFMLRVQGDSMVEAGILDKDYVLVKQQSVASNGEIVVALIDDEATIKTFYKEKDHIRLQPQNKFYEPIIVRDNVTILGKVIGVFRKL